MNFQICGARKPKEDCTQEIPRLPKLKKVNDSTGLKFVSTLGAENGMAEALGVTDEVVFAERYPALSEFRAAFQNAMRRIIEEDLPRGSSIDDYSMRDDFGFLMSGAIFEYSDMQLFHLDFSEDVVGEIDELGHWLFVGLFPFTDDGMVIRILPEPPFDERGGLIPEKKPSWSERASPMTIDEHDENGPKKAFGGPFNKKRDISLLDGKWVFIARGSMMVMPASLYHAGDIRTSVSGNKRGHFYFYCRRARVDLVDIFCSLDDKTPKQEYLNSYGPKADAQQQYLRDEDTSTSVVFRTAKGLELNQIGNQEWLTEGVRNVCQLLAM